MVARNMLNNKKRQNTDDN